MRLSNERLNRLTVSLDVALDQEWPKVGGATRKMELLRATPIRKPSLARELPAIATVATDGGENKLSLEPMEIQVLRVADSRGEIYFEEFVAESLGPREILKLFLESQPRLRRLLSALNLQWEQLLPDNDLQRSHLLSMLRELMEWTALIDLAGAPPAKLLIRDGLLRSVLLSAVVFARLRARFEELTRAHGHLLAGVAKRSRTLSYLSLALELAQSFASDEPAYLRIPAPLEQEAAPAQYRWIGHRAMGHLFVARLDRGESVPLMPIDLAAWQSDRAEEAMFLLHQSSQASFPTRGYPQPLVDAHEHARLGGMEVELLESLMLEKLRKRDPDAARAALELRLGGQRLSTIGKAADEN
jgi:hypothetical protein